MKTAAAGFGLALALFTVAGCEPETGGVPAPTPPSPAPAPPPPPAVAPERPVRLEFTGLVPAPGAAISVRPGTDFVVPVVADERLGSRWPGIPVRVVTSAPPAVLSVPGEMWVGPWDDPAVLRVHADAAGDPTGATYAIHLEPWSDPFLDQDGRLFEVDPNPLLVRVAEPVPPPSTGCGDLSLTAVNAPEIGAEPSLSPFWLVYATRRTRQLVLRSARLDAQLRILEPYGTGAAGNAVSDDLVFELFAMGMDLRPRGSGFEQRLWLAWADELRLRAAVPGCAPVELNCDETGPCQTR